MKIIFLLFFTVILLIADDPCDPHMKTEKIFHQELPYNVVLDKYYSDDNCGYRKTELKILQNGQLIDSLDAFYCIDILRIEDINNDGKTEIVYTGHSGGQGTDEHRIAVIEPIMKKSFAFDGFPLNLRSFNDDGASAFISWRSVFFCITSDFCSNATFLGIQEALQFKNGLLVLDKEGTEVLKKESAQPCDTNVLLKTTGINNKSVEFTNNECAKNTLKTIAYDLYFQDTTALKMDLKHFIFQSNEAKKDFKHKLINELKEFNITPDSDFGISTKKLIEQL